MENSSLITKLFNVSGKIALVTGSTRGIGLTLARGLAQARAAVLLNGTDKTRVQHAVAQLRADGFNSAGFAFDVCKEKSIQKNVQAIEKQFGQIDILVNNAGIMIRKPLEEFSLVEWQKVIDVNLTGAFLISKAVVRGMIERREGKIINICSVQSELARPTITPYTASKGGLRNLTRGMAADWGKYNIQINGIAPGYFKTEMTTALYQDKKFDAWLKGRTPAHRWGDPQELLGALLFLSSKASDYMNGQLMYIDGGLTSCV